MIASAYERERKVRASQGSAAGNTRLPDQTGTDRAGVRILKIQHRPHLRIGASEEPQRRVLLQAKPGAGVKRGNLCVKKGQIGREKERPVPVRESDVSSGWPLAPYGNVRPREMIIAP